ncbi:MAG: hypothetical protein U1E54_02660 [Candidatus Levybacteria bacterium]|nr:hypothetical protein [Candidatus Levybacteria bacterium]
MQKPSLTWQKFRDFISRPTQSRTMGIVVMLVLVSAVSLTVMVAQQQQTIKQRAATNITKYSINGNTGECVADPRGFYTTPDCDGLAKNITKYSINGNTGECVANPRGYYTTPDCKDVTRSPDDCTPNGGNCIPMAPCVPPANANYSYSCGSNPNGTVCCMQSSSAPAPATCTESGNTCTGADGIEHSGGNCTGNGLGFERWKCAESEWGDKLNYCELTTIPCYSGTCLMSGKIPTCNGPDAPSGCKSDSGCVDDDECTIDSCNTTTGKCSYSKAPDGKLWDIPNKYACCNGEHTTKSSCTASAKPPCNSEKQCDAACTAPSDTCGTNNGTKTCSYTALFAGGQCTPAAAPSDQCTAGDKCVPPKTCTNGTCTVTPVNIVTLALTLNTQDVAATEGNLSADLILYNLTTSSPVVGAPTTQVFNRIYVTGKQYSANISLTNLPQDKYFIVVRKDSMIAKAAFTVSSTTGTITVPTTILVFGDLNNDNNIDTLDYNMFKGCWNNKVATGSCASSDFDKNKTIDQIDFNTFIRGWATWNKEGK